MSAWNTIPGHDEGEDTLETYCWCNTQRVIVPREMVLGGLTESCGRPGCSKKTFLEKHYKARP